MTARGRVLIFVVAYEAQKHIRSVFERVPPEMLRDPRYHFLCIDDASTDDGPQLLADWLDANGISNATVMRNPVNQGYGGNQKLGYRKALDDGYDFVILLHGDGQYAPELLGEFVRVRDETGADVVLGSRMAEPGQARRGGMPLYKWVGNRVLTWFQNRLTRLGLTEYHTGYRGYSTEFLRQVPFEINTPDFHFDTEILLQAAHVGARIVEFAIPTHYGDEVCRVPGLRYATDVVLSTIQWKMHQMGMLCSLKYRDLRPGKYIDKTGMLYTSHTMALRAVERARPGRALDIGCGPGFVARACGQLGVSVTGLDAHPPLEGMMDRFLRVDLEREHLPVDPWAYDVVLMLDVIEHLAEPEQFLVGLRNHSSTVTAGGAGPLLLLSTPNIAFIGQRLGLACGRFNYAERGILDITHKRLFTRGSLLRMLRDCGYRIERVEAVPVPFEAVVGGWIGRLAGGVSWLAARVWGKLFGFQFLVHCRPLPGVRQCLASADRTVSRRMAMTPAEAPEGEL